LSNSKLSHRETIAVRFNPCVSVVALAAHH